MTNYGIIGCGMMGHEHLTNIALLEGTNIAAIYEPDAVMEASAFRIAPNSIMAQSIDDLFAVPNLDCLVIASPNHCHMAQMQQIASSRPLPLLVEKPLFTAVDDQSAVLQFAKTYASPVWVAMEYRYMPPVSALIERAEDSTGGIKMLTIREHRFPFLMKVDNWNRFATEGRFALPCRRCCDTKHLGQQKWKTNIHWNVVRHQYRHSCRQNLAVICSGWVGIGGCWIPANH